MRVSWGAEQKVARKLAVPTAAFALVVGLGLPAVMPVVAFAEEAGAGVVSVTDATPTNGEGIIVADGSAKSYAGNVTEATTYNYTYGEFSGSYDGGVIADNKSTVSLDGNVSIKNTGNSYAGGVFAEDGSSVDVTGSVTTAGNSSQAVTADGASVRVGGDVAAEGIAVSSYNRGKVTVDGDVSVTKDTNGDSAGAWLGVGGTAEVGGDVTSDQKGASIMLETVGVPSTLVVKGTISGDQTGVELVYYYDGEDSADPSSAVKPVIVTGGIATSQGGKLISGYSTNEHSEVAFSDAQLDEFAKAINYIVNADDFEVSGTSTVTADGTTYTVAHEGDSLTFRARALTSGLRISSSSFGSYASSATRNADGSYTITVARGGNLSFALVTEGTANTPAAPSVESSLSDDGSAQEPTAAAQAAVAVASAGETFASMAGFPVVIPSAPVTLTGTDAAQLLARRDQGGSSVAILEQALRPGTTVISTARDGRTGSFSYSASQTYALDLTGISREDVGTYALDALAAVPDDSLLVLDLGDSASLTRAFLEALEGRSGVTVVVRFVFEGEEYEFVILPGTTAEELVGSEDARSLADIMEDWSLEVELSSGTGDDVTLTTEE